MIKSNVYLSGDWRMTYGIMREYCMISKLKLFDQKNVESILNDFIQTLSSNGIRKESKDWLFSHNTNIQIGALMQQLQIMN